MNDRQYVHVVRYSVPGGSGTLSVHSTRKQGLVAALQAIAEHVEYDWSVFSGDLFDDFVHSCGIDDEGSLDDALNMWNESLCREYDAEYPFRVNVSIEQLETEDAQLDMELPAVG